MSRAPTYTLTRTRGEKYFSSGEGLRAIDLCAEGIRQFFHLPKNQPEIDIVFLKRATPNSVTVEETPVGLLIEGKYVALAFGAKRILFRRLRQGYKHVEIRYWKEEA